VSADNFMGNGPVNKGKIHHITLGVLDCFADSFRHFTCLSKTTANLTVTVAHDDQRAEAEAPAALYDLGHTINGDDLIHKIGLLLVFVCQVCSSLKLQALFAGAFSNSFDPAVKEKAVAVKNHRCNVFFDCFFCDQISEFARCSYIAGLP
jgi:hypothetical protein